ncbi:MAG: hypothetical protein SGBAC_008454 [Bacillariaceae sp.]
MTLVSTATRVESSRLTIDEDVEIRQKLSKKASAKGSILKIDDNVEIRYQKLSKKATAVLGSKAPKSSKKRIIDTTNEDLFVESDFSMSISPSDLFAVNGGASKMRTKHHSGQKATKGVTSKKHRTGKSEVRDKQPTPRPTPVPSPRPTKVPSKSPSLTPTVEPTPAPTPAPEPTPAPTPEPTSEPTLESTLESTLLPSSLPINRPSNSLSEFPTIVSTIGDSSIPFTDVPTSTSLPTPSATALIVPLPAGDDDDTLIEQNNNTDDSIGDDIIDIDDDDDDAGASTGNVTDDAVSVPDTSVGDSSNTSVTPFIAGVVGIFVLVVGSFAFFRKKKRSGVSNPPPASV